LVGPLPHLRTPRTHVRILAARIARVLRQPKPPKAEGAGNAGCWPHPRALRAKKSALCARKQRQVQPEHRHSLRNGLRLIARSPRCTGLDSHRRLPNSLGKLDPSIGRSGPHAFAVREECFRQRDKRARAPRRPPHPASCVRDDRDTPLMRRRDTRRQSYFSEKRK